MYHITPLGERHKSTAFCWQLPTATAIRKGALLRSAVPNLAGVVPNNDSSSASAGNPPGIAPHWR